MKCKDGMMFDDDLARDTIEVTCKPNNTWQFPSSLPQCVMSKYKKQANPISHLKGHVLII